MNVSALLVRNGEYTHFLALQVLLLHEPLTHTNTIHSSVHRALLSYETGKIVRYCSKSELIKTYLVTVTEGVSLTEWTKIK